MRLRVTWLELSLLLVLPAVALAFFMLRGGAKRYDPPDRMGHEAVATHNAGAEVLRTGLTSEDYHPTGHYYYVAAAYALFAKKLPSVVYLNILLLPLMVLCIPGVTRRLWGETATRWAFALGCLHYPFAFFAAQPHGTHVNTFCVSVFIASAVPLILEKERQPLWRPVVAGLALGAATCIKPYYGFLGTILLVSIWFAQRSFARAVKRSAIVAAVSLTLFGAMIAANPAREGTFLRGGQGAARSMLMGTYQYEYQWFDTRPWVEDPVEPGAVAYRQKIDELQRRSGRSIVDPATVVLMRGAAIDRYTTNWGYVWKKAIISQARIWILLPTFTASAPLMIACGIAESLLFVAALVGIVLVARSSRIWLFCMLTLLLPGLASIPFHIEARYSVPVRAMELALAAVGLSTICSRVRVLFREKARAAPRVTEVVSKPRESHCSWAPLEWGADANKSLRRSGERVGP